MAAKSAPLELVSWLKIRARQSHQVPEESTLASPSNDPKVAVFFSVGLGLSERLLMLNAKLWCNLEARELESSRAASCS